MSEGATSEARSAIHPIALIVEDDLGRSRPTVFFRLLLALPHIVWLELWGLVVSVLLLVAWLTTLVGGRLPDGMHAFLARYLRYTTAVYGYVLLLADPFPPFSGRPGYPIDLRIAGAQSQNRLTVLFRLVLALPALLLSSVFRTVNEVLAFLSWFYALATGRVNRGMRDLSAWLLRYEMQTFAYVLLLTSRYPSLAGAPMV
jgi:hypothetical protein